MEGDISREVMFNTCVYILYIYMYIYIYIYIERERDYMCTCISLCIIILYHMLCRLLFVLCLFLWDDASRHAMFMLFVLLIALGVFLRGNASRY